VLLGVLCVEVHKVLKHLGRFQQYLGQRSILDDFFTLLCSSHLAKLHIAGDVWLCGGSGGGRVP
jgi:hypothetical protein